MLFALCSLPPTPYTLHPFFFLSLPPAPRTLHPVFQLSPHPAPCPLLFFTGPIGPKHPMTALG